MAIVGYARVSSTDQDTAIQLAQLREAGADPIYAENRSGTTMDRPELDAAIKALRPGDILLVTRLDRFARHLGDLCKLLERVKAAGAEFKAVHQQFSTDGPTGRLMLNMLGVIAEFETDLRKERQMEGIAKAKAEGRYDPARHAIPPAKLSWCSKWLGRGWSYAQVAEKSGVSIDTLQRRFPQYKSAVAVAREKAKKEGRPVVVTAPHPAPRYTVPPHVEPTTRSDAFTVTNLAATPESFPSAFCVPTPPDLSEIAAEPTPKRRLLGLFRK